jgi:excisionase family DNA binding protein
MGRDPKATPSAASTGYNSGMLLSPGDVARACGLSRRAIYRAIARGELQAARLCNRLRVRPADVERWISEQTLATGSADLTPIRPARRFPPGSFRAMLDDSRDQEEAGS